MINNPVAIHDDSRLIDHHVHVNWTSDITSVKNVIPDGDVNVTTRLFLFFEITIALTDRIQPDTNFSDIIGVFNCFDDVTQFVCLATFTTYGDDPAFFDLKGDLDKLFDRLGLSSRVDYQASTDIDPLHPGQAARIRIDGDEVGMIGMLHPQVQKQFDLNQPYVVAELGLHALMKRGIPVFAPLSKYPETSRDLALVVANEVAADDILRKIKDIAGKLLKSCELFDTYIGENIPSGCKSLAFSLVLQSEVESLGSESVDNLVKQILAKLEAEYGATLRT